MTALADRVTRLEVAVAWLIDNALARDINALILLGGVHVRFGEPPSLPDEPYLAGYVDEMIVACEEGDAPLACVGCGLVHGAAYPCEPSVMPRADGKARCNDCANGIKPQGGAK